MTGPTRDEVLQWARDAEWSGLYVEWGTPLPDRRQDPAKFSLTVPVTYEQLQRFAAAEYEQAREALGQLDAAMGGNNA